MKRGSARSSKNAEAAVLQEGLSAFDIVGWEARRVRGRILARLSPPFPAALASLAGEESSWWEKIHRADRPAFATWFAKVKRALGNERPLDYRLEVKPGAPIWIRHWLRPAVKSPRSSRASEAEFFGLIQVIDGQKRAEADGLRAAETERFKLGQELHDETGQLLAGLACLIKAMRSPRAPSLRKTQPLLIDLEQQLSVSLERIRTRAHTLVPGPTIKKGLAEMLRKLAAQAFLLYSVKIRVSLPSRLPQQSEDRVVQLHGIVHESIANAVKHGRASSLEIRLRVRGKNHVLSIEDNGLGLRASPRAESGIGLHLMNHRAVLIGGRITVENRRPHGVRVQLIYPVAGTPGK